MNSFWNKANEYPNTLAMVDADGVQYSAGELRDRTNRIVHGLRELGLGRGDTVAVILPNCAAMVEVALACGQAGMYITPINHHLTAPETEFILEDCKAKVVVCHADFAKTVETALSNLSVPDANRFVLGEAEHFVPYRTLWADEAPATPQDRCGGFAMTYTSGTTGRPRGVRRPMGEIDADVLANSFSMFLKMFGIADDGVHLVVSPLYHTAVLNWTLYSLHLGHTVIVADKWSAKRTLELIETFSVTTTHMVPTQFVRLLELSEAARKQHDLSSLTHMVHGAAPCPIEIKHRMLDWLGPVVYEYYAASEGGGTLATPKQWLARPGTVGAPWPISTLSIRDDSGNELAPGEVGTVWIHMGDHKFEYHGDKKKTAQAWADRFFTVGDAGYLDEDGFLFLCDRKADMIISGGVNIYPAEIEGSLILHESVADCAVFGIPDDDWGEQVKAVVQLASGNAATLALTNEILAFCGERLAKYKCPRTIDFVEALPRDPNGKLYKRKLREPYWSERSGSI